jgi:hypothetical protein
MSESDTPVASVPDSPTDPLAVLATLPKATQLLLRDYIAGLEAQAGSARALAEHHERQRHREVDLLRMKLSGMRDERDAARDERDTAVRSLTELAARAQTMPTRRR